MSDLAATVRAMLPTLATACQEADTLGTFVRWVPLPGDLRGLWHAPSRTIYLREGMAERSAVCTLLHEIEHVRRGDDGPQPASVEARIDRAVACRVITAAEYVAAERVSGGRGSGAVAAELGLPRWVVRAYRETLRT